MPELAELYLFFAVIYLLECAAWVPRATVGLVAAVGGRWRGRRPLSPNPTWARGALLATPWPPLSPALLADPLPLAPGPSGVLDESRRRWIPWNAVTTVAAVGARLEIDGEPVARFATRRGVLAVAAALADLPRLAPADRAAHLQRLLDARFDEQATAPRLQAFRRETRALRVATNMLWIILFVGLPAVFWLPTGWISWLAAAAAALVAWVTAAVLFERTLRRARSLPRSSWPDLTKRVVAVSSPLATMRSVDLLARELVGDLDPLAVAAALDPRRALAPLLRPRMVDLMFRFPRDLPAGEGVASDVRWWRERELARIRRMARDAGLDPEALVAPPGRDRDDMVAWCPECLAQYDARAAAAAVCPNDRCREITLVRFEPQ